MVAGLVQSYRSMGCHTWHGGRSYTCYRSMGCNTWCDSRSCTILQIYGVYYVVWWPILYNPIDTWGVIRDKVTGLVQFYRSMECHTWYGGRSCTILQIYRVQYVFQGAFLRLSLRLHPRKSRTVSDKHGQWFHQDISTVEKRCQGKWSNSMLVDYCWTLRRQVPQARYSREWSTVTF